MEQRINAASASKLVVRVQELIVAAGEAREPVEGRALLESALVELEVLRERMIAAAQADERVS